MEKLRVFLVLRDMVILAVMCITLSLSASGKYFLEEKSSGCYVATKQHFNRPMGVTQI